MNNQLHPPGHAPQGYVHEGCREGPVRPGDEMHLLATDFRRQWCHVPRRRGTPRLIWHRDAYRGWGLVGECEPEAPAQGLDHRSGRSSLLGRRAPGCWCRNWVHKLTRQRQRSQLAMADDGQPPSSASISVGAILLPQGRYRVGVELGGASIRVLSPRVDRRLGRG